MAKHALGLQRIASAFRCSQQFHCANRVLDSPPLDRRKRRRRSRILKRLGHVLVGNAIRGISKGQIL